MSRRRGETLTAAGVVLAAVGVVAGIVWLVGRPTGDGDSSEPSRPPASTTTTLSSRQRAEQRAAQAWDRRTGEAFAPLVRATPPLVTAVREWLAGARTTDAAGTEVRKALTAFTATRDRARELPPFALAPAARGLAEDAALLYLESARIDRVLLDLPAGPLRDQVDLLARRVRELADRVFDRARALVEPFLREPPPADIEVHRAEEVPDWVAEGLAAGPPLEDVPPPPAAVPPLREAHRPQQPRAAWVRAVARAGVPAEADLVAGVDRADGPMLRTLAEHFVSAAEQLRGEPDPTGDREVSARARLALLVFADGARAAQAATVVPDPAAARRLEAVARRLVLVADRVWSTTRLPRRASGFDPALLRQDGP